MWRTSLRRCSRKTRSGAFSLLCGQGFFDDPGGAPDTQVRSVSVGEGLPSRPGLSVGPASTQGTEDECSNMVVMVTSEGNTFTDCVGPLPQSGVRIRSWREF